VEDGRSSFSYWYGQHFAKERDAVSRDNILETLYRVSSLEDLENLPQRLSYQDVWHNFSRTFDGGSSVSVHEITHYVVVFRHFMERIGVEQRGRPLGI
jgi:hypothetical protein